jgi:glutamate dehydrogenase
MFLPIPFGGTASPDVPPRPATLFMWGSQYSFGFWLAWQVDWRDERAHVPGSCGMERAEIMTSEDSSSSILSGLGQAFAVALKHSALAAPQQDFIDQVVADIRGEELPTLSVADAAANLADFWDFAGRRQAQSPLMRLARAVSADGRDMGLDLLQIVQADGPFLVDSVMGELAEGGFDVRAMVHPVVQVGRDADGVRDPTAVALAESMILVVLGDVGEDRRASLLEGVERTLADVHMAVGDFDAMTALMETMVSELVASDAPFQPYNVEEYVAFLRWLASGRFVFLGARSYDYPLTPAGDYAAEEPRFGAQDCLGVLRDQGRSVLRRASEPAVLTSELKTYLDQAAPLVVAKSNLRSRVHRRGYMDYVGVKRYARNEGGRGVVVGEVRFVGLFTAEAYEEPARQLPLIRRKIEHVLARAGANPSEHTEKRLRNIVETYPRDELFQIDEAALFDTAMGILHLYDRPRVRLFVRLDPFDRFVSALLFIPRDRYDSEVTDRAGELIAGAYGGRVSAAYPSFSDQSLARVLFIIGLTPGDHLSPDLPGLEAAIADAVRTWSDRFEAASRAGGVAAGRVGEILARYSGAFPAGYRDRYDAAEALADLSVIEAMGLEEDQLRIRAYRTAADSKIQFRFKLYQPGRSAPLADVLPILDNMGLKAMAEEGYPVSRTLERDGVSARFVTWVHEFLLEDERGARLSFADVRSPFEDTFLAAWTGQTESDGFNRLVLELGASWREAALIRALCRYRQQSGLDPSQAVQEAALRDQAEIARLILDMFKIKFDPAIQASIEQRQAQAEAVYAEIVEALQDVASLDADRVLRRVALLVRALVRTNFYQTDEAGAPKPQISFKIASRELEDLPAPKPYREIFVWSPSVEGVHLRFGPVARGGLRWSDRRDDFRTEVLGLVKAQQVKNAVIVPVGSKGGFYPKSLPRGGAADAVRAEGVRAYKTYLHGLLDLTDNLDPAGAVVRPPAVIAHDVDDPYLVVAADKGTATFSDIANGAAQDYGFWLGDAFASGGSVGYDHKVMGITARGAWEAVKRHFRELGKDIQSESFTCVGVGDMSGDVFGNGALLSKAMMLVAAFDHRDIFLDPEPDLARSWDERKRLFDLPRSSWQDYDKAALSPGGRIFSRTAKTITLTPQIKALLDLDVDSLAPNELIQAILKARVELLYLGGIGTYVKAAGETQAEAGDKANDLVRVDAGELRCQVVGEGANLGFTQAGRIAFTRLGGRIDTDAIDNSAGVDTSDHEVNIKILLGQAERAGVLAAADRNPLLASMTDEVAAHVLAHNYNQTLGLSLQEADAPAELDAQARFMIALEAAGRLDRKVEGLPRASGIAELKAQDRGLTRPELAVLTAYGKLELSADIVAGSAPDDPYFAATLEAYFPTPLARFKDEMARHRLRREIISTVLANTVVDRLGPTFASRLTAATGADATSLIVAFEAAREIFRLDEAWQAVNALDLTVPAGVQLSLYGEIANALRGQTFWLARRPGRATDVQTLIDTYRPAVEALQRQGEALLSDFEREGAQARFAAFIEAGAPENLARTVAVLRALASATEVVDLAQASGWPVEASARLFNAVGAAFGSDRLRAASAALQPQDAYERAALRGLVVDSLVEQTTRTRSILAQAGGPEAGASAEAAQATVAGWAQARQEAVDRAVRTLDEVELAAGGWSFAKLTIANAAIRAVV